MTAVWLILFGIVCGWAGIALFVIILAVLLRSGIITLESTREPPTRDPGENS